MFTPNVLRFLGDIFFLISAFIFIFIMPNEVYAKYHAPLLAFIFGLLFRMLCSMTILIKKT